MLTGSMGLAWHQHGVATASKGFGRWKIEFAETGDYKISLRRFPIESGLGFHSTFMATQDNSEIEIPMPASSNIKFKSAMLYVAGFSETKPLKEDDKEATFTTFIPEGKYDMEARLTSVDDQVYPAYYVYIEKIDAEK